MINNYSSINLTKLDVLSFLDTLKVGMYYTIDGKRVDGMPSTLKDVYKVKIHYKELPGWKTDISSVTNYDELPLNARKYVEFSFKK